MPNHQNTARPIVERFGGATQLAKATGIPVTTISGWIRAGHVPHKHIDTLLEVFETAGVPLEPIEFVIPKDERKNEDRSRP